MKRILAILMFFSALSVMAGGFDPYKIDPDYEKAVRPMLSALDAAGAQAYAENLPTFTSLSQQYPREWRGYYWEAFANIRKAEVSEGPDKEIALNEAERLITRAEMFIKENPDLYLLRAWVLHERIQIDPVLREPKYGPDLKYYLNQTYLQNPSNPRYFFLKGLWSERDTTEAGKAVTLRYFSSADKLFADKPVSKSLAEPDWGRGETQVKLGLVQPAFLGEDGMIVSGEENVKEVEEEAVTAVPIPEYMQGAVLPNSLTDENAGELILDSSSTEKAADFKLFSFRKNVKKTPVDSGEVEVIRPEAKESQKEKVSKSDSKKKLKFPSFGKKNEAAPSPQGNDILITSPEAVEPAEIGGTTKENAKQAEKKKEKEIKKTKAPKAKK